MPRKYSQEEFLEMARKGNPILQVCGVYQGMQKKIDCKCLRCNRVMAKKAQDVIKGIGCRYCAKTQTSFAELFLAKAIQQTDENIRVLQRDRSAIGEELDIYLPDYQFAVEPGAWYYHKKRLTT
ncbi:MAG: hypothetical protein J5532_09425, partial [Lachnospiraceae bacterium]|nr:hypothetical protein [Lachnospiraceae bacterium]